MQIDQDEKEYPIEVEQILLYGTMLKNTQFIYRLSVYTGKHSKLMMNSEDAPYKMSKMEKVTNKTILALFVLQWFITILCAICSAIWQDQHLNMWYLFHKNPTLSVKYGFQSIITFFTLFHNMIPIRCVIFII
jgi:phospholipid-transporting ATPase